MRYIGGGAREEGCIFCNRLEGENDVDALILHRSHNAFVIMNLYPYNTGHVMVVPNTHKANLDALDEPTLTDMALLLPKVVAALRRVFGCDGFNIGLNLGSVAGAGVADHLHQHVVPRWEGDANFMPIIAGTMVIPELIPSTYAKIRAELARELGGADRFDAVVVSDIDGPAVWLRDSRIPTVEPGDGAAVWRAAVESVGADGAEIVGWSGGTHATDKETRPGIVVRTDGFPPGNGWQSIPWEAGSIDGLDIDAQDRDTIRRAERHLAPWVAASR